MNYAKGISYSGIESCILFSLTGSEFFKMASGCLWLLQTTATGFLRQTAVWAHEVIDVRNIYETL
jgi:hypothetical protein